MEYGDERFSLPRAFDCHYEKAQKLYLMASTNGARWSGLAGLLQYNAYERLMGLLRFSCWRRVDLLTATR